MIRIGAIYPYPTPTPDAELVAAGSVEEARGES